jgi:hypothetical protein
MLSTIIMFNNIGARREKSRQLANLGISPRIGEFANIRATSLPPLGRRRQDLPESLPLIHAGGSLAGNESFDAVSTVS